MQDILGSEIQARERGKVGEVDVRTRNVRTVSHKRCLVRKPRMMLSSKFAVDYESKRCSKEVESARGCAVTNKKIQ